MAIKFHDYSIEVRNAINARLYAVLEESAGELESVTKRLSRKDTRQTSNSFEHKTIAEENIAYIGSNYENAIWEEFGTGEHALNGDGRKDIPWHYKDAKGKWHTTTGKKPSRAFWHAYISTKNAIIKHIESALKGL